MNSIPIRSGDMRLLQKCTLLGVIARAKGMPLDRVDFWPRDDGPTTVGVTWADESFCIFDLHQRADIDRARRELGALVPPRKAPQPHVIDPAVVAFMDETFVRGQA